MEPKTLTSVTGRTSSACDVHGDGSSTKSNSVASGSSATSKAGTQTTRAVHFGRILFVFFLVVVAVVLGTCAHFFLKEQEIELAESQFEAINERALNSAVGVAYRKVREFYLSVYS